MDNLGTYHKHSRTVVTIQLLNSLRMQTYFSPSKKLALQLIRPKIIKDDIKIIKKIYKNSDRINPNLPYFLIKK